MPETLFDSIDDWPAYEGPSAEVIPLGTAAAGYYQPQLFEPLVKSSHRDKFDRLRQSAVYRNRRDLIRSEFDFENLSSGMLLLECGTHALQPARFKDWLETYGHYLSRLEQQDPDAYAIDKAILRVELRRLVKQLNTACAADVETLFPDTYGLRDQPAGLSLTLQ